MPSTIYLTLGPDVDAGHFAWRHLRSHVVPALNQRFARVGVEVQIAQGADQIDEGHDHVVTIGPYSVDDLAKPNRDVVEEIAQLIAAESLEATIESSPAPEEADDATKAGSEAPPSANGAEI